MQRLTTTTTTTTLFDVSMADFVPRRLRVPIHWARQIHLPLSSWPLLPGRYVNYVNGCPSIAHKDVIGGDSLCTYPSKNALFFSSFLVHMFVSGVPMGTSSPPSLLTLNRYQNQRDVHRQPAFQQ